MIVADDWNGKALLGLWEVSRKLDGVRALSDGKTVLSRKGKPLYGLDHIANQFTDAEIYCGSFKQTITIVRSHNERPVHIDEVFTLDPLASCLFMRQLSNPSVENITKLMKSVIKPGECDGIVLRQGTTWIKCKPILTFDMRVIGVQPGKGKHQGRMGALETIRGKVGTGFTDQDREELMYCVGKFIEVECLELTPDGKFRHARFLRCRPDKD